MSQAKLDLLFFQRLWRLFGILFERYNSRAALIFYTLAVLSLLLQFVIYAAGLVPSKFFEVLGAKDISAFPQLAAYSIFIIVLNALMKSTLTYISRILYLTWRQRLCAKLHENYFKQNNYYELNALNKSLDNMDQRITRDANLFTKEWSVLISRLVVIPFTIVYYSYQCFVNTTWLGPVIIYAYFIVGTIVNRIVIAPIVRLNVEQEVKEGDFRYQHLKVRVNSESIAFYHADAIEHKKSNRRLKVLLDTQMSLFNWSFWLNSSVNVFDYVGGILSYLVIAIPIFSGVYDDLAPEEISALISKNSFVCIYLIHSFSQLIDMSSTIGDIAAHTHRLAQVLEVVDLKKIDKSDRPVQSHINSSYNDQDALMEINAAITSTTATETDVSPSTNCSANKQSSFENEADAYFHLAEVSYHAPNNPVNLVESLTLTIRADKNVLVTGSTGSGKTSLLRVLAGLHSPSSGTVKSFVDFGSRGVMYLPQNPLLTDGTLKDQIIYPRDEPYPEYSDSEHEHRLNDVIAEVGLSGLVESYGGLNGSSDLNWADKLSTGEMQRLSFARLFYHHPGLAVLDEPTSGLSEEAENHLFSACIKRKITCLTVGHRKNLKQFHDVELHLCGDGNWTAASLL